LCVSDHTDAVVSEAMEQNYSVAVAVTRLDGPSAQGCAVLRADGNIGEIGIELVSGFLDGVVGFRRESAASRMQDSIGDENPRCQAAAQIHDEAQEKVRGFSIEAQ